MPTKCASPDCERLAYDGPLCGMCQKAELDHKESATKQAQRYYSTILSMHQEGKSDKEIARSLQMRLVTVTQIVGLVARHVDLPGPSDEFASAEQKDLKVPALGSSEETICAGCDRTILAGAYRVVLMAVEIEGLNGRGDSLAQSYCESCVAELPALEMFNIWKLRIDARAQDALESSPSSEDAFHHSETGRRVKDRGKSASADFDSNDEPELHRADKEATEFSDFVGLGRGAAATKGDEGDLGLKFRRVESIRREALRKLQGDRQLWGRVGSTAKKAVTLYVSGMSQKEIARKLNLGDKGQGTVSNMLKAALKIAGVQN